MSNRRHMLPSFIESNIIGSFAALPLSVWKSHMLFFHRSEIAGNIRRPDYQKAHYFYCSFIPQMLWDGREETDAASSFPTKLTKFSQFHHLCLQKETSRLSIFSHLDFRGMAGNAPPGYLLIWTGRLTGACWEEQLNKHCIIVTVIIINIIIMIWMRWLTAVLVGSH